MNQLHTFSGNTVTPELRSFALTLHFYSPAAYNYVRKTFKKCLPHPSTIRKWYSTIDGSPGITQESLNAIAIKVTEMKQKNLNLVCGLIMDEMSIREAVHFNGKHLQGYINYGHKVNDSDAMPKATEVLVFLIVALNSHWKIPVAYFLINGLTAEEKANLLETCLINIHETGAIVKTLTFDGAASNISMARHLGADLHNQISSFLHPVTKEDVCIFLDPAHMLKLVRNTIGDWEILYDADGNAIEWKYFKELVKLQEDNRLHLATKIRSRHVFYSKEKMKVSLAAQVLSTSVADALLYCKTKQIKNFENCNATITFCRKINDVFDFLNTRNFLSKLKYKKPLFLEHETDMNNFIDSSINYLKSLQSKDHLNILTSPRKTGFNGLIVCLQSMRRLFENVIKTGQMSFILSYKISQDHLEMLFSAIRSRGGFNNNPTAAQFEATYKRLLVHTELSVSSNANCAPQDSTSILFVSSGKKIIKENFLDILCVEEEQSFADDNEQDDAVDMDMDTYRQDIIEYISGFVVKQLKKTITCHICCDALVDQTKKHALIDIKNRGGLIKSSTDVITLCKASEQVFISRINEVPKHLGNPIDFLIIKTMSQINIKNIFPSLNSHILSQSPLNNHLLQIVKFIIQKYMKIRLHYYNNQLCQPKKRLRSKLTKIILFQHQ